MQSKIKENPNIFYHGILNETKLAELYRSCDVFVYPTRADSFPLVILQALSSGMYVLTSDNMRGIYDDFLGKVLEYVPRKVKSFQNKIIEIIKNREVLEYDRYEIYSYVRKSYDWSTIAEHFYESLRSFVNESN